MIDPTAVWRTPYKNLNVLMDPTAEPKVWWIRNKILQVLVDPTAEPKVCWIGNITLHNKYNLSKPFR